MEIILDTNFILTCTKMKIDLFSQLEEFFPGDGVVLPSRVLDELEKLSEDRELKIKEREAASLSLQILRKNNLKLLPGGGEVDDIIIDYATSKRGILVATLDKGIRKQIRGKAGLITIMKKRFIGRA